MSLQFFIPPDQSSFVGNEKAQCIFCKSNTVNTNNWKNHFHKIRRVFQEKLQWKKCVAVTTDGAAAMV